VFGYPALLEGPGVVWFPALKVTLNMVKLFPVEVGYPILAVVGVSPGIIWELVKLYMITELPTARFAGTPRKAVVWTDESLNVT
jgi:hypothetical protein